VKAREPAIVARITRQAARLAAICTIILVVCAATTIFMVKRESWPVPDLALVRWILIAYFSAIVLVLSIFAVRYRLFRHRARQTQYELCTNCLYPLDGLPDIHRCPECGIEYDRTECRELWRAWLKDTEFRVS
jgi:hypothetical protein